MSLICIVYVVSACFLAIFKYEHAEASQNTPQTIRKCWKKRWKSRNAIHRNCRNSCQLQTCRRGSHYVCICEFHTYMIEYTKYFLRLFSKNIFSCALPLYQSHVFMIYKHENYCTAKQLQKEVRRHERFFVPSFWLIIIDLFLKTMNPVIFDWTYTYRTALLSRFWQNFCI